MALKKVKFKNNYGEELVGRLHFPEREHPKAFALFAHCFTCGKNLKVIKEISKALTEVGLAVLRFDFTGLGQSEGDFENTNFSHDVEDLKSASRFLENEYKAPNLIVGHSLGGTAALFAAKDLDNIKAIATIASPSQPAHVQQLIKQSDKKTNPKDDQNLTVNLGGKDFKIKKQFLEDIKDQDTASFLGGLKKPYLIMHSPQDQIVSIENAEELYRMSHHPKSFISLDQADHLLNDNIDASYIGSLIGHWASNSIDLSSAANAAMTSQSLSAAVLKRKDKFTTQLKAGDFEMIGDEPESHGGNNFGPAPYDLLAASLAECTAMTLHVYAKYKNWDLEEVKVHIDHDKKHPKDVEGNTTKKDVLTKKIEIKGDLTQTQIDKLIQIGDRCPIHKTLHSEIEITSELINQK